MKSLKVHMIADSSSGLIASCVRTSVFFVSEHTFDTDPTCRLEVLTAWRSLNIQQGQVLLYSHGPLSNVECISLQLVWSAFVHSSRVCLPGSRGTLLAKTIRGTLMESLTLDLVLEEYL